MIRASRAYFWSTIFSRKPVPTRGASQGILGIVLID
jgi:hypothetical protein